MEGNNDPVIFEHSSELDRHSIFINQMSPKVVLRKILLVSSKKEEGNLVGGREG